MLVLLVICELAVIIAYYAIVCHAIFVPEVGVPTPLAVEKALNVVFLMADSALAGSLIVLLHRKRSGIRKTDSVIRLIIIYTLSSTAITSMDIKSGKILCF